jgi:hypothetical protein
MKVSLSDMEKFSDRINKIVQDDKLEYIDAIVHFCEESGIEVEIAAKLITPAIRQKIEFEAMQNRLIQKYPVLPI